MSLRPYYRLVKPGIIYGNMLTALAGYFFASSLSVKLSSLLGLVLGLSLVIASACVINNLLDRRIDAKMKRTRSRPSVTGEIPPKTAATFATLLAAVGFSLIALLTNMLCLAVAALGFIVYTAIYTPLKPVSHNAALIGSISGAVPIVAGYLAYTRQLTAAALILGAMMVAWQMPHFYAIAIYRGSDYSEAGVPVLPEVIGKRKAIYWMVFYAAAFLAASVLLHWFSPAGRVYLVLMGLIGVAWLGFNIFGLFAPDVERWARRNFFYSLVVILLMSPILAFR